jgi:flagellar biosynthesis component FlhA
LTAGQRHKKQLSYNPDFVITTTKRYMCPSAPPLGETEYDIHLHNQTPQCTEISELKQRINNVTDERVALREKVTGLENIYNTAHEVEASHIAHERVRHAMTEYVQDLKLTAARLSSELQELKVSHSVASHEDKQSASVIFSLHLGDHIIPSL